MQKFIRITALAAMVAGLAACGDTLGEQAILGAGAGAGTAVALDGDVATGALVGAAANVAYCRKYPSRC
jgi:malic enzyme